MAVKLKAPRTQSQEHKKRSFFRPTEENRTDRNKMHCVWMEKSSIKPNAKCVMQVPVYVEQQAKRYSSTAECLMCRVWQSRAPNTDRAKRNSIGRNDGAAIQSALLWSVRWDRCDCPQKTSTAPHEGHVMRAHNFEFDYKHSLQRPISSNLAGLCQCTQQHNCWARSIYFSRKPLP